MPPGVIAFSKDWDDDPTSNHHVLRELAKTRRVLWLNSVAARTPTLTSAHDRRRILRKLAGFFRRPVNVENDLWVFTPIVVPFPHSRVARRLNALILGITLARLRRRLGLEEFELWTFLPSVADYIGTFGESLSVYYCVDEFSLFTGMDARETLAAETALLRRVDCVFAVNPALVEAKRRLNPRTFLALHGAEHELFARALDRSEPVPDDIARLPRPVLGYYGTLEDWVDLELIAAVARRRPNWSIVLIGRAAVDTQSLDELDNVHLLGRRPHTELPDYCRAFDVALIPYRVDGRTPFVNPIKLREYLSAGLPVVSTPLDEALRYPGDCAIAGSPDDFVAAVERALEDDTPEAREARSGAMKAESWQARVGSIRRSLDELELPEEPPLPIVAFSKDWDDNPASNHHVLTELAKSRRVLWLNSVGTRSPRLSDRRDVGRIFHKLRDFLRGPVNVEHDLWVFTPLVLPLPHSRLAGEVNRLLLRATVRLLRWRLGIRRFQLWTFLPSVAAYVGTLGESLSVYYCVDEWSMFSYIAGGAMVQAERLLLKRVDCVFAVNEALVERKRVLNPETHLASHGVDQPLFSRALDPSTPVSPDIARLPEPVIGFFGTVQDWVDLELVADVARRRPDWSIVLIGRVLVDTSAVDGLPNVHLLGQRPYQDLPAYCRRFGVGVIPYRTSEQLTYRNPLKLREYLAAGLPVVSTAVPEAHHYDGWCTIATDAESFVRAVEVALDTDTPELRAERARAMELETWDARVARLVEIVDDVAARRRREAEEAPMEAT